MEKKNEQPIYFDIGEKTDKGRVRSKNEDKLGFFNTQNGQVVILCDGMGGHSAGAHASEIAVNSIREYFESNRYEDILKALEDSIKYANNQVFDEAKDNIEYLGMGTTCVLCVIQAEKVYYAHVGDSRLYICRNGAMKQLTKDHSFVQNLIENGEITEEEADSHPRKNELLRAVGVSENVEVDVCDGPIEVQRGNVLLLCSDGLNNMVNKNTIEYVLGQDQKATAKAEKLVELAIIEGGYDNVSVQVIDFNQVPIDENIHNPHHSKKFISTAQRVFPFLKKYPKAIYGIYALILLLFAYAVFDMFFKNTKAPVYQDNQEEIVTNDSSTVDTIGSEEKQERKTTAQEKAGSTNEAVYLTYTIRRGDAISLLSHRFNIKPSRLMEVNNMDNANINVGQQIKIPLKAIYTIKPGDNLYDVAQEYGVTRKLLRKANGLKNNADIYAGENLYVPFP